MRAIQVSRMGGPEVLEMVELPNPVPAEGEVLVRVAAAGINYIDTYHRTGLYARDLPFVLGQEGAGIVEALGPGVVGLRAGDRVAWWNVFGSYAEFVEVPVELAVPVPDDIELETAAALMLQGLTAHYLAADTFPLQPGDRCLIHAAAGGVGALLVQVAKRRGAEVFATVGSAAKAELAKAAGADHVVVTSDADFGDFVEEIAGPRPLAVVYDGVGAATFDRGLELLRRRGMMVAFGNASGPVAPFDVLRLSRSGSLFLTRPTLGDYVADRAELARRCAELFAWVTAGELDIAIGNRFPLDEAAEAHRALEGRRTTRKLLLIP